MLCLQIGIGLCIELSIGADVCSGQRAHHGRRSKPDRPERSHSEDEQEAFIPLRFPPSVSIPSQNPSSTSIFARSLNMISRRALLTNSAVGAVALAAAVTARELPAMAGNGNGNGNGHGGDHENEGRNRDRNHRSNRGKHRRRNNGKNNGRNGNNRRGRGNANGGLANGTLPTAKDVIVEGNGDQSDNLEQKRERRRNRRERRRNHRRRGN
jgi:hypothetical protein